MLNFTDLLRPKDYAGQPVRFLQPKADGIRLLVRKHGNGRIDAWTRNGLTDHWPDIRTCRCMKPVRDSLPDDSALDCELHVPGEQATDVITRIKEGSNRLVLTPFALPWYVGFDYRHVGLEEITDGLTSLGFTPPPTTRLPLFGEIPSGELAKLRKRALTEKLEGYVVKVAHYEGWYKIKPVKSVDCVVVGVTISDSDSFAGGLKAVQVAVEGRTIASVGTGFLAEFRMSCKPQALIGRVCEVSYDSLAAKGQLKFPRFVRWRDDKTAAECKLEQLK